MRFPLSFTRIAASLPDNAPRRIVAACSAGLPQPLFRELGEPVRYSGERALAPAPLPVVSHPNRLRIVGAALSATNVPCPFAAGTAPSPQDLSGSSRFTKVVSADWTPIFHPRSRWRLAGSNYSPSACGFARVRALFGFQLAIVLTQAFERLPSFSRMTHVARCPRRGAANVARGYYRVVYSG
jgi:hypothetical protein